MNSRTIAALGAGCLTVLWVATAAAQPPTGQQRAEAAGRAVVGAPAPGLVVRTIEGESIDLGALYGKQAVYLKFWATWCIPCLRQMPHFEQVHETAGPDLAVIGVNTGFNDSLADVREVVREGELGMPTVIDDGRLAAAFNLRVTPQHIVIGRSRRIEYVGHLADERLDAALRAARAPAAAPSVDGQRAGATAPTALARHTVGDVLPDLAAATLDGRTIRLRDASERRPTALVFLSPWCESYLATPAPERSSRIERYAALATSCREVREQVASLASRDNRVRWLGVVSGLWSTPDELREYDAEHPTRVALTMDESGEWFRAFDVSHVPTIVIADGAGKVAKRIEGFDPSLDAEIERMLAN
jgi:thiol-disulfide isomerase/thioredoxin